MLKFSSISQTTLTENNTQTVSTISVVTELEKGEYPIILLYKDTLLTCFTIEQARKIAKGIRDCDINADIIIKYEEDQKVVTERMAELESRILIKQEEIELHESKEIDLNNKISNKNQEIVNLNLMNKNLKSDVLKYKIAAFGGFSLAIGLPIALLLLKK